MKQLFLLFMLLLIIPSAFGLEAGDVAPKFVNPDLSTKYFFSKDVIGKGWVILDFFATDCDGCKKELPEIEQLYLDYKDFGLSVIVLDVDEEGPKVVIPYFEEHPTILKVLIDRYKKTAISYDVDEIPAVFLVNPEGVIVLIQIQYSEDNVEAIRAILKEAYTSDETDTGDAEDDQTAKEVSED